MGWFYFIFINFHRYHIWYFKLAFLLLLFLFCLPYHISVVFCLVFCYFFFCLFLGVSSMLSWSQISSSSDWFCVLSSVLGIFSWWGLIPYTASQGVTGNLIARWCEMFLLYDASFVKLHHYLMFLSAVLIMNDLVSCFYVLLLLSVSPWVVGVRGAPCDSVILFSWQNWFMLWFLNSFPVSVIIFLGNSYV